MEMGRCTPGVRPLEATELLYVFILLASDVAIVVTMLYLIMRVLHWSREKALPGANRPIFNLAIVGLTAMVAMLVLIDFEFVALFQSLNESLFVAISETDLFSAVIGAIVVIVVWAILRRVKR